MATTANATFTYDDFEMRKSKVILGAMLAKFVWLSGLVILAVFGQSIDAQIKLYVIFGSGLAVMLAAGMVTLKFFTSQELKKNFWLPTIIGIGALVCVVMLWLSFTSPPSF